MRYQKYCHETGRSLSETFTIDQADMNDVKAGSVIVLKGKKAAPILIYGSQKLGTKDYAITSPSNLKFDEDGEITVEGKGNFKGTRRIPVKVVENASELRKFNVTVQTSTLVYNGEAQTPSDIVVKDPQKTEPLTENLD